MWSISAFVANSAFSVSAGILSDPPALLHMICLIAMLISSYVPGTASFVRCVGATSILGRSSGPNRFKSTFNCSTDLFYSSSMLINTLLSLLFTDRFGL